MLYILDDKRKDATTTGSKPAITLGPVGSALSLSSPVPYEIRNAITHSGLQSAGGTARRKGERVARCSTHGLALGNRRHAGAQQAKGKSGKSAKIAKNGGSRLD